ncbi:hypothetical protein Bpfe_011169 [Biomphalaria pfeifferi]|uniref:Uncharacterized protein n=1 Tax=Biomphalaria pfeifferi TaxID=112525 RepID=A0AAD8BT81_BIOPF|nr:hypothetical protein Bpfe_011169 [Biomphalaria pfeifferi]
MFYQLFNLKIFFQCCLLLGCIFGVIQTDEVEATLRIKLEKTSINYKLCQIRTGVYQKFQDSLFNLKTTAITIKYNFLANDIVASAISSTASSLEAFDSYISCYNDQTNTQIVCNRTNNSNLKCTNEIVILWTYEGEYLNSVHLKNATKDCVNGKSTFIYTLQDSGQSTSYLPTAAGSSSNLASTNANSQPENSQSDSSGIIAGVVVSIVLVILITIIAVYIKKRREKESPRLSTANINNSRTGNEYQRKIGNTPNSSSNITSDISTLYTHTSQQNVNTIHISHNKGAYSQSEADYTGIDDDLQSTPAPEDDFNHIDDFHSGAEKDVAMSVEDGYSNIDLTRNDYNEILDGVEIRHTGDNSSNILPERRKDVYSKLGEKLRSSQSTYGVGVGICEEENVEDELKESEAYFSLESAQQDYNVDETVDNYIDKEQVDNVVDKVEVLE